MVDGKTDFMLIRAESADDDTKTAVGTLYKAIEEKTGVGMPVDTDWLKAGQQPDSNTKEILVGITNRNESAETFKLLDKAGFAVKAYENKIVIIATNSYLLPDAIEHFISEYIEKPDFAKSGYLAIEKDVSYTNFDYTTLAIVENNASDFAFVIPATTIFDEEVIAKSIQAKIEGLTSVTIPIFQDDEQLPEKIKHEIIIGRTNRAETADAAKNTPINKTSSPIERR